MIFIFGTDYRFNTVGTGQFQCPVCGENTTYERQRGRRYVTIYFLPIIPFGDEKDIIRCTNCGARLNPKAAEEMPVKHDKPRSLADLINGLEPMLRYGRPVEYALTDLTDAGLERERAIGLVKDAIGTERRTCPNCALTYADNVERCAECDVDLTPKS